MLGVRGGSREGPDEYLNAVFGGQTRRESTPADPHQVWWVEDAGAKQVHVFVRLLGGAGSSANTTVGSPG
jgi:hypothetical protein